MEGKNQRHSPLAVSAGGGGKGPKPGLDMLLRMAYAASSQELVLATESESVAQLAHVFHTTIRGRASAMLTALTYELLLQGAQMLRHDHQDL